MTITLETIAWTMICREAKKNGEVSICFEEDLGAPWLEFERTARSHGLEVWKDEDSGEVMASCPDSQG